jgi:ferredoxin
VQDGTRRYCDDLNCYRMGLATSKPGSIFTLTVDTSAVVRLVAQQQRSYPAAVLDKADLAVLYTQSPRGRLGIARLSCIANCACKSIVMDGVAKDGDGSAVMEVGRTEVSQVGRGLCVSCSAAVPQQNDSAGPAAER